jgi:hypothetical protein
VNIKGLVNARDVTDVIGLESERINAQSTKDLYQLALNRHPEAENILIISDNARYYKNKLAYEIKFQVPAGLSPKTTI